MASERSVNDKREGEREERGKGGGGREEAGREMVTEICLLFLTTSRFFTASSASHG